MFYVTFFLARYNMYQPSSRPKCLKNEFSIISKIRGFTKSCDKNSQKRKRNIMQIFRVIFSTFVPTFLRLELHWFLIQKCYFCFLFLWGKVGNFSGQWNFKLRVCVVTLRRNVVSKNNFLFRILLFIKYISFFSIFKYITTCIFCYYFSRRFVFYNTKYKLMHHTNVPGILNVPVEAVFES